MARLRRSISRSPVVIAGVVLLLSLLSTLSAFTRTESEIRQARVDDLDDEASAVVARFRVAVEEGWSRVISIQGLFEASRTVTEDEFLAFVRRLGPAEALATIGFAPLVTDIESFEREVAADHPGLMVHARGGDGTAILPPSRSEHYPVLVERRFADVETSVGFDLVSDPVRARAIESALDVETPKITSFVDLPGDTDPRDIEVVAPVMSRDNDIQGIAFAALQLDEMLDMLTTEVLDEPLEWDLTEVPSDTDVAGIGTLRQTNRWSETIDVHGAYWHITFTTGAETSASAEAARSLVIGILVSALLSLLAYVIARSRVSGRQIHQLTELAAAKDRFLASVSHELRTPLTTVMGLTSILAAEWHTLDATDVQDYLDMVEREGTQLADLVDDLLIIERVASDTLVVASQVVDLDSETAAVSLHLPIPEGKRLHISSPLGAAMGDRSRVRQILRNLLANAIRYAESAVRIDASTDNQFVRLRVHNDGAPIDDERISRIFTAYEGSQATGQPASLGTGLWLSSCLARLMGGTLTYSAEAGGSAFILSLPLAGTRRAAIELERIAASHATGADTG